MSCRKAVRSSETIKKNMLVKTVAYCYILQPEGEDELKRRQLMELAIINGTYRDTKSGTNPQGQTNDGSPPSSLSPLGGAGSHPAAIAAAVASRKCGHDIVIPACRTR